jgi:hypothetical protein
VVGVEVGEVVELDGEVECRGDELDGEAVFEREGGAEGLVAIDQEIEGALECGGVERA